MIKPEELMAMAQTISFCVTLAITIIALVVVFLHRKRK